MTDSIDQAIFLDAPSLNSTVVLFPSTFTTSGANVRYGTARIMPWISGGSDEGSGESDSGSGDGDGTDTDKSGGDGTDDGGKGSEKTLSQDEVNRIVAREIAKAQRGKLDPKELGFESGKELKDFLDQQKQAADEAKTQAEKDLEEAKNTAREEAEKGVLAKANERLVRAEFVAEAAKAGVSAPADAYVLAKTMEIWTQVELVEENDDVTVKGFDEDFFKELKQAKPYLFAEEQGGAGGRDLGGGAGGGNRDDAKSKDDKLLTDYPALRNLSKAQ